MVQGSTFILLPVDRVPAGGAAEGGGGSRESPGPRLARLLFSVLSSLGAEQDLGASIALPIPPRSLNLELEADQG